MSANESTLSLIDTIYAAALDGTLWPKVLGRLAATTDAQGATFWILDSSERLKLPTLETFNFAPDFIREYLDFMTPHDPTVQYLAAHPDQKIVHDTSFISEAEKNRHMYYDWHGSHSDTRHRVVGNFNPAPHIQSGIALHRARSRGDFEPETIRQFTELFRHVERALQIGFRLGTLGSLQQVSMELVDRNPVAILLLDDRGSVILANPAALALSKAGAIGLSNAGITLPRALDNRRLQRLIGDALRCRRQQEIWPGGAFLAARPARRRPLSVLVSPLSSTTFTMTNVRPLVCIAIADPEKDSLLPQERLRALYGLTLSEARLATRLAAGEGLRDAAGSLGIGYATARTQLAAIFRKTETRRQGELIMLLLKTVPLLAS